MYYCLKFGRDTVGDVWKGAGLLLPVEVATHLARIAQREGQQGEGATKTAFPSFSLCLSLFLNGSLSLFGWPSLSAIQIVPNWTGQRALHLQQSCQVVFRLHIL